MSGENAVEKIVGECTRRRSRATKDLDTTLHIDLKRGWWLC